VVWRAPERGISRKRRLTVWFRQRAAVNFEPRVRLEAISDSTASYSKHRLLLPEERPGYQGAPEARALNFQPLEDAVHRAANRDALLFDGSAVGPLADSALCANPEPQEPAQSWKPNGAKAHFHRRV
jgi:hypothetical protein